jgi:DNA-binding protein YbaB
MAALGLDSGLEQLTTATAALDRAFDEIIATAVSPDRLVKVTVTGRGEIRAMEFDPGIYEGKDPRALADTILATVASAHAAADAKVAAAYESFQEQLDD